MERRAPRLGTLLLWLVTAATATCTTAEEPERVGQAQQAYGEPINGFPNWYERASHVLVNRARCDTAAALAGCSGCPDASCFSPALPPMMWSDPLGRAARFHADSLTLTNVGMQHDSACRLVTNIASLYPDSCDGSATCACDDLGTVGCPSAGPCNFTSDCPPNHRCDYWGQCNPCQSFGERIQLFGPSPRAENIAGYSDPVTNHYQWLWETASDASCSWTSDKGHRWNILGDAGQIGVGAAGSYCVQDYSPGTPTQKIAAGAHFPKSGTAIAFRTNWYDSAGPQRALVNVDGTCHAMSLERGSTTNGSYLYDATLTDECHRYFFVFEEDGGGLVTYPDTGAFGISCGSDWTASRTNEDCSSSGAG
ncbi:MAG: hypothetical protein JRI23_28770, partial [Deltaproteobacteria bacterium]|nr:hypothetical protein [Deltaproteobacteria bacterium]MBW2536107.1 hypothetical protein [Deltaproteobacteria bacterium]